MTRYITGVIAAVLCVLALYPVSIWLVFGEFNTCVSPRALAFFELEEEVVKLNNKPDFAMDLKSTLASMILAMRDAKCKYREQPSDSLAPYVSGLIQYAVGTLEVAIKSESENVSLNGTRLSPLDKNEGSYRYYVEVNPAQLEWPITVEARDDRGRITSFRTNKRSDDGEVLSVTWTFNGKGDLSETHEGSTVFLKDNISQ